MSGPVPDARRRMPVVPKPHVAARVLERLLGTRAKVLAWEQIGASRAVQKQAFGVVFEESGIACSAQIGLVLNRATSPLSKSFTTIVLCLRSTVSDFRL